MKKFFEEINTILAVALSVFVVHMICKIPYFVEGLKYIQEDNGDIGLALSVVLIGGVAVVMYQVLHDISEIIIKKMGASK